MIVTEPSVVRQFFRRRAGSLSDRRHECHRTRPRSVPRPHLSFIVARYVLRRLERMPRRFLDDLRSVGPSFSTIGTTNGLLMAQVYRYRPSRRLSIPPVCLSFPRWKELSVTGHRLFASLAFFLNSHGLSCRPRSAARETSATSVFARGLALGGSRSAQTCFPFTGRGSKTTAPSAKSVKEKLGASP